MDEISICVPTYNGGQYIKSALLSILDQTFPYFELIVSDDRSTDNTQDIVRGINDLRLRLVVNDYHLGLVGNWNHCLELTNCKYVQIFHQDDILTPDAVDRLISALQTQPDKGFVFSNIITINELDERTGGHWNPAALPKSDIVLPGKLLFNNLLKNGNFIPCQTVMARTECYQNFGFFDSRLKFTPDLEMWLRLSLHTDAAYLNDPLVKVRRHTNQETNRFTGTGQEVNEVWRALEIIFTEQKKFIPEPEKAFNYALTHLMNWSQSMGLQELRNARFFNALRYAALYIKFASIKVRKSVDILTG